ncbi:MAG: ectonucleotide pyrophosphatase/phosphodiesterase [Planctomycetota bacterium]|jgi:phosphonoacetate hydrolase|nr:ectonucleotide pyrophosphatase/phosphodiesterase [Planctomycetota bacterium]
MRQRVVVGMLDGFGWDYWERSEMPNLRRLAAAGSVSPGKAVFPTLTNVNNVSIACGCWPDRHGVATNCYFCPESGTAKFLEDSSFLRCPTLFSRASAAGVKSALLTCKGKTLGILGPDVELGLAAETLSGNLLARFRPPPPMYSADINYWLWDCAVDILRHRPDIGFVYVHTTDYPMHRWAPDAPESLEHLRRLDEAIGETVDAAPDAALLITADHGMNPKAKCIDLARFCSARGKPIRFAVSPVADRLLAHHGGHGGVSYIYLERPGDADAVGALLRSVPGVEAAWTSAEAAARFHLPAECLGDLVAAADKNTVFGTLDGEEQALAGDYRNHGSLHEVDIPLIAYNLRRPERILEKALYNFELTSRLF